jgi:hypothetical protein
LVLGGDPNRVEQEQKILVAVKSWTCTSSPMTGSYFVWAATESAGVVSIGCDYKGLRGAEATRWRRNSSVQCEPQP